MATAISVRAKPKTPIQRLAYSRELPNRTVAATEDRDWPIILFWPFAIPGGLKWE
jgi:hypothetical protein